MPLKNEKVALEEILLMFECLRDDAKTKWTLDEVNRERERERERRKKRKEKREKRKEDRKREKEIADLF